MTRGWWRTAVVYQVYVRSFADGDGDGIGDLRGLVEHLDALTRLGVDALWLTPIYPSPQADHGYDVADPRDVDPLFGDLETFDRLVDEAHARGLRVVLDLVPNHVSDQHPWFRQALADGPGASSRERFHMLPGDRPPTRWRSMFGGSAWTRLPDGDWYLHLFAPEQPDLNWAHPDVRADAEATLRFWVARGVDGFRVDVAGGLAKDPSYAEIRRDAPVHPHWDRPDVHEIYRSWRKVLDDCAPDVYAVAEAWGPPDRTAAFARSDELGQVFAFELFRTAWSAAALRRTIHEQLLANRSVGAVPAWVVGNHDVARAATRLGADRSLALHLFLLAMPGAFYLYAGDELGLPDVDVAREAWQDPQSLRSGGRLPNRDGARIPLPWTSSDPSFGFTTGTPWLPMPPSFAALARDVQEQDPASPWSVLHHALRERRRLWVHAPALVTWLPAPPGILVAQRGTSIVVLNASSRAWPLHRLVPTGHGLVVTSTPHADPDVVEPSSCVWLSG
ncbi:alpha-amylase family glycosyl hydrolase [Cellulomonas sp. McL0617]|uniref:alpha-amylase family glycosyl hydrolase n=1 Tax=Cellulomonas sp. McL0617 TaxID=3415675 RepID=UPI003CF50838